MNRKRGIIIAIGLAVLTAAIAWFGLGIRVDLVPADTATLDADDRRKPPN